jgi:hypothetical protein
MIKVAVLMDIKWIVQDLWFQRINDLNIKYITKY